VHAPVLVAQFPLGLGDRRLERVSDRADRNVVQRLGKGGPVRVLHLSRGELIERLARDLAEAVGVRERALLLEDAAVDAAPELLDEVAEHVRVDLSDHALGLELDARARRRRLGSERRRLQGCDRGGEAKQPEVSLHGPDSFRRRAKWR
jgi:hypothetical protein